MPLASPRDVKEDAPCPLVKVRIPETTSVEKRRQGIELVLETSPGTDVPLRPGFLHWGGFLVYQQLKE